MPPTSILTPSLIASITKYPQLQHSWYFITATALCILNRPDEIPGVYKYALNHGADGLDAKKEHEEKLLISRRLRESLIKASAVGGLPKTINALLSLKNATPVELQDELSAVSPTSRRNDVYHVSSLQILKRGQEFFDKTYGKVAKRVMGQMDRSGTEDLGLAARLLYGHILSNTDVLNSAETSFVMIAGLIPQDVNFQLKGHLRGALNGGASVEEVKAVREIVIRICEASGMKMLGDNVPSGWGWREEVVNL